MAGELGVQIAKRCGPGLQGALAPLVIRLQQHLAPGKRKLRRQPAQLLLAGPGPLQLQVYLGDTHRLPGSDRNRQEVSAVSHLLHLGRHLGVVIAERLQSEAHLLRRLQREAVQPEPVHLAVPHQAVGERQRLLHVFQGVPLHPGHHDLYRVGGKKGRGTAQKKNQAGDRSQYRGKPWHLSDAFYGKFDAEGAAARLAWRRAGREPMNFTI